MVLPSALVSTYNRYKRDTDSVAAWLASTAKSHGFPADLISPAAVSTGKPATGGRLKGKARTQAKLQKVGSSVAAKQATTSARPRHIIQVKDFTTLAEYIAKKAIPVPEAFTNTINRVIAARSAFGFRLEKHGQALDEDSDKKHGYFLGVLEKVRETLKPLMPAGNTEEHTPAVDTLGSRFGGLTVFEPSPEYLDALDVERPTATPEREHVLYEAEAQTSIEDALFALAALINDMNQLKTHVKWIWLNYRSANFDPAAAAIATNTAIDLVRNITEDVSPLLEKNGGYGTMLQKFYVLQCLMKGVHEASLTVAGKKDNFNYETWGIASATYYGAYRLLDAFSAVLEPGQVPLYKEGMFGYFDPATDHSAKAGPQMFADDRALLMPFFNDLVTAVRLVKDWPIKDEFFCGMEELSRTGSIPFYGVFATQIFLDITYVLGPDISKPFLAMQQQSDFICNDIQSHFDFHQKLKMDNWPASNDSELRSLQHRIRWIDEDPVRQVQTRLYQRMGHAPANTESHRIFRMSPVLSGLMLYHFRGRYRQVGLALADSSGSVQYCQHLYNSLQQQKLLQSTWLDMEVLYANLGAESFYVGGQAPQTPEDCFKKFNLQMGTSVAAMSKSRRRNTPLASRAGPRGLREASPVLSMFWARHGENSGQLDLTPEHVDQIIKLSLFEEEEAEEEGTLILARTDDPAKLRDKRRLQQQAQGARRPPPGKSLDGGHLAPAHLIKPLALALQSEMVEFAFPYMRMHRQCWQALRAVKESCDTVLRQLYTPAYIERESQLPSVVGWILTAASGMDGGAVNLVPLQEAAGALEEFIRSGGADSIIKIMGETFEMPIEFEEAEETEVEDATLGSV